MPSAICQMKMTRDKQFCSGSGTGKARLGLYYQAHVACVVPPPHLNYSLCLPKVPCALTSTIPTLCELQWSSLGCNLRC